MRICSSRATRFAVGSPARITYWLKKPAQNLKLEILDAQRTGDAVVRWRAAERPDEARGRAMAGEAGRAAARSPGAGARFGELRQLKDAAATTAATGGATRKKAADAGAAVRRPRMAAGVQRFTWDLQSTPVVHVPGHGAVGRDDQRSGRAAGHVSGAADRRRPAADAGVHGEEASVPQRHRRRPAGAVGSGAARFATR